MSTGAIGRAWFSIAKTACKLFCIAFFRYRVYGIENIPSNGSFILASNHQSFLDPLFCGVMLRRHLHFLARDTLFRNWFFGRLIRSVNTTPVRRGEADIGAIKTIISKLRDGRGVLLFPEGTRTSDGRVSQFKSGMGLLCRRSESAIIPVAIEGAFECWPRTRKLPIPGSRVRVRYGRAISAKDAAAMGDEELAAVMTKTVREMQAELRRECGKEPFSYE